MIYKIDQKNSDDYDIIISDAVEDVGYGQVATPEPLLQKEETKDIENPVICAKEKINY